MFGHKHNTNTRMLGNVKHKYNTDTRMSSINTIQTLFSTIMSRSHDTNYDRVYEQSNFDILISWIYFNPIENYCWEMG